MPRKNRGAGQPAASPPFRLRIRAPDRESDDPVILRKPPLIVNCTAGR